MEKRGEYEIPQGAEVLLDAWEACLYQARLWRMTTPREPDTKFYLGKEAAYQAEEAAYAACLRAGIKYVGPYWWPSPRDGI